MKRFKKPLMVGAGLVLTSLVASGGLYFVSVVPTQNFDVEAYHARNEQQRGEGEVDEVVIHMEEGEEVGAEEVAEMDEGTGEVPEEVEGVDDGGTETPAPAPGYLTRDDLGLEEGEITTPTTNAEELLLPDDGRTEEERFNEAIGRSDQSIERASPDALDHILTHDAQLNQEELSYFINQMEEHATQLQLDQMDWATLTNQLTGVWIDTHDNSIGIIGSMLSVNGRTNTITDYTYNGSVVRISTDTGVDVDYDVIDHRMMLVGHDNLFTPVERPLLQAPYGVYVNREGQVLVIDQHEVRFNTELVTTFEGSVDGSGGGLYQVEGDRSFVTYPYKYRKNTGVIITPNGAFTKIY